MGHRIPIYDENYAILNSLFYLQKELEHSGFARAYSALSDTIDILLEEFKEVKYFGVHSQGICEIFMLLSKFSPDELKKIVEIFEKNDPPNDNVATEH